MRTTELTAWLSSILAVAVVGSAESCNPVSSSCAPNLGLPTSTYSIDFTQQTAVPDEWTLSDWAKLGFESKGAEFTVSQRYEAPQLWTNFFIFFGKVETVMQVAPGTGIISSAVLMSDDLDEIDWEFSGNNFGTAGSTGLGQNNYYGKGVTGWYDRSQMFDVTNPQSQFHTYTVDWTPETTTWSVDGIVVRTLYAANADTDTHQYPQTPAKLQLGIWAGGDPGNAWGTVNWAGGYTNFSEAPFTSYVKSVKITSYNPAYAYNWTDQSGSASSIQLIQKPVNTSSSTTSSDISNVSTTVSSDVLSSTSAQKLSSITTAATTITAIDATSTGSADVFQTNDTNKLTEDPTSTTSDLSSSKTGPLTTTDITSHPGSSSSTSLSTTTISPTVRTSEASTSTPSSNSSVASNPKPTTTSASQTTIVPTTETKTSTTNSRSSTTSTSLSSTSAASYTCPDNHADNIVTQKGNTYTIGCGNDTTGGGYLGGQAHKSFNECFPLCDAITTCVGFVYSGAKNGAGAGNCYLKLGYPIKDMSFTGGSSGFVAGLRVADSAATTVKMKAKRGVEACTKTAKTKTRTTTPKTVSVKTVPPKKTSIKAEQTTFATTKSSKKHGITTTKTMTVTGKTAGTKVARSVDAPPQPQAAKYLPRGGRWMWDGHGDWMWVWN